MGLHHPDHELFRVWRVVLGTPLTPAIPVAGALMALVASLHLSESHGHGQDDPTRETHSHPHRHVAMTHAHRHWPDLHHGHSHG